MKLFDKTMKMFSLLCLLMVIGIISCVDNGFVRRVERVGEDVVLPCSLGPENNIEPALFDWTKGRHEVFLYNGGFYHSGDAQFRGRVSHFPDKLKNGNASIIIRNSQLSDSGNYSCFVKQHLQEHRSHVELVVGIFAEPRVMILEITKDRTLLQCEVRGASPKPQISWIDSDENVLNAEEKLEDSDDLHYPPALMLQTNVTKTGIFRCRVTQKELNFTTEAQISVPRTYDKTVTGSNGVLLGVAIGSLTVVLLGLVVVGIYWWYRIRPKRAKMLKDFISPKNEQFTMVSASHVIQPTTQKPHSSLEEEEVSRLFLPQPVDNQDRLDHSLLLAARKSPDSDYSSHYSSDDPERPNAINSPKDKRLAVERRDSGVSSLHSSHHPAKAQETRKLNQKAEPDKDVKIPL